MRARNHLETALITNCFSNDFYFSFMLGLVDISDIAYRVIGQIIVVNKVLILLISLYFSKVCFHERAT